MSSTEIKLTQFSKSSGCGCKIAPAVLQQIIKTDVKQECNNLLIGFENNDDAAVYEIENNNCIISTTDFFTPIVDDPFDFGRIAAANAISDIYAMGGKPIMALSVLGWPVNLLSPEIASVVLKGARSVCDKAGIPIAGGHSIDSTEPIFGLSVTGIIAKSNIKKNNAVNEGDLLYLTKPIGSGILATALKRNVLNQDDYINLVEVMTNLNKIGEVLGDFDFVSAMTDVTGFGLIGHLSEMLKNSAYCAELTYASIPLINNIEQYTSKYIYPDNTTRNYNAYKDLVDGMNGLEFIVLCDPQTSGGLLISCRPDKKNELESILEKNNIDVNQIGIIKQSVGAKQIILK